MTTPSRGPVVWCECRSQCGTAHPNEDASTRCATWGHLGRGLIQLIPGLGPRQNAQAARAMAALTAWCQECVYRHDAQLAGQYAAEQQDSQIALFDPAEASS
jgi:hypothetical protein